MKRSTVAIGGKSVVQRKSENLNLRGNDWIFAVAGVMVFLGPLVLVMLFSGNRWVELILGGGRIFVVYVVLGYILFKLEKRRQNSNS